MFRIRQAKAKDAPTLAKMARMVYFINLPPNEQILTDKIQHSQNCFVRAAGGDVADSGRGRRSHRAGYSGMTSMEEDSEFFMFVIEEIETDSPVGTSQVRAHQGGPGNPNWSLKLDQRRFHSEQLGQGTTHTVARLYGDETGPTELGGLILQPSHRGHKLRPGRLLSFVRFHFIGLYREVFSDRVIAEMMGPVSNDGDNEFWDHFGRKFIPVKFAEADRFCQHNRKFIDELLPKDDIYLTLFPLEVQNVVGVVSRETLPARRLLESMGFKFKGFVDPFDGGPHLDATTSEIPLVQSTVRCGLGKALQAGRGDGTGIVSVLHEDGEFRAIECEYAMDGKALRVSAESLHLLEAEPGDMAGMTPLPRPASAEPETSKPSKAKGKPPRRKSANESR
jgi:arginine N-succinyltransferase